MGSMDFKVCSLDGVRAWKRPEPAKWAVHVTDTADTLERLELEGEAGKVPRNAHVAAM